MLKFLGFTALITLGMILYAFIMNHFFVIDRKTGKISRRDRSLQIAAKDKKSVQFYEECQKRKLSDLDSDENLKTAVEILKYNKSFSSENPDAETARRLFQMGKSALEAVDKRKEEKEVQHKEKTEQEEAKRRELLGEDAYQVILAARQGIVPEELFHGPLRFVASVFKYDFLLVDGYSLRAKDAFRYYVFRGKDKYYSYIPDTDQLTAGYPNVYVKQLENMTLKKDPDQLLYTSATVGGITTGGVDVVKGKEWVHSTKTEKYCVFVGKGLKNQVHNCISCMWCCDDILNYLEYNGVGDLREWPVSAHLNSTIPGKRYVSVGQLRKEECETVAKILKKE